MKQDPFQLFKMIALIQENVDGAKSLTSESKTMTCRDHNFRKHYHPKDKKKKEREKQIGFQNSGD